MVLLVALAVMAAAAAAAPLLARRLGRDAGYPLSLVFVCVGALVVSEGPRVLDGGVVQGSWGWMPSVGVSLVLRLDGLALLFAVVVLGVGALVMFYCPRYLSQDAGHGRLYALLVLFAGAMLGLVLAGDMVLLFVFWELTTLCSFFLIGGVGLEGARPATRALVVTGGGGLALLVAVVLLSVAAGSSDLGVILTRGGALVRSPLTAVAGPLLVLAAFSKSAQLPLHFWLPDAMVAITPVSAYLHAATLVKGGVYLLLRFSPLFADRPGWHLTLITVGLVTAVVGAVFALQQHDLKAILAYSTVSQLGFIIALVGVGTAPALAAAALHTFAHALFKATLFMLVGIIDRQAGSRDIRQLSGLWRVMPVTATLTGLAALSMAGVAPLVGFVSKEEAYGAFLATPAAAWTGGAGAWIGWAAAALAVAAASLTFAYGFRILSGAFGGPTLQPGLQEPSFAFLAPAAVPAVAGLLLGLNPAWLNPLVNRTVADTRFEAGQADLALWHGLTPALLLSAVTIMVGGLLFALKGEVDRRLSRLRLPVTGAEVFDRIHGATLRLGARVGRSTRTPALSGHLAWPLVVLVVVGLVASTALAVPPPPAVGLTRAGDWPLLLLLTVAVTGLVLTRSRMAAVVLLGVTGFVVGVWFLLLGAPDLALTQLLVEVLTVVVVVLVLRRLPELFRAGGRVGGLATGALAVLAGIVAGAATLTLTGRRELSAAGRFLLEQAEPAAGGTNVVNTVLVDFRGLDTLGEIAVLAVAALGLMTLLRADSAPAPAARPHGDATADSAGTAVIFGAAGRLLTPVLAALSLLLLLRGHNQPGGGFIAALLAGAGVAIRELPRGRGAWLRERPARVMGAGLALAGLTGALGFAEGAYLRPLRAEVAFGGLAVKLSSSLLFDVGVFLVVVALVITALDRLGRGRGAAPAASPEPVRAPDQEVDR